VRSSVVYSQPGTYAAIYGATVANFPKAMFVTSAILLYMAVSLLARMRPNIHIPPVELEGVITSPPPEGADVVTVGRRMQVRSRSRDGEPEQDVIQRISLSIPED
jgi:hypothetical protein